MPGSALAQGSNPFGPVQSPAQPPPAPELPEPEAPDEEGDDDGLGGTAFWMIIGATGLLFAGIAFLIMRDMRKTTGTRRKGRRTRGTGRPAADAAEALAAESHRPGSQRARAKAQQRAKTKAARKQRRKSRSR
jgi:predicted lipid-binding transport protein (Tim44 family)